MEALRLFILSTAIMTLAAPAVAEAATATLSGARLSVNAGAGETNRITVDGDESEYVVTDTGATLRAGSGCMSVRSFQVRCPTPGVTKGHAIFVEAGDGDDSVVLRPVGGPATTEVHGSDGRDRLLGDADDDLFMGGDGDDFIFTNVGNDTLNGGADDDFLQGGDGRDRVSYADRRRRVVVDLGRGDAGQRGESDTLLEIEDAIGGRGADRLSGDGTDNALAGGRGRSRDVVDGRGGADTLVGRRAIGGGGNDLIDGRAMACGGGRDTIFRQKYRAPGPFHDTCELVVAKFVVIGARPLKSSPRRAPAFRVRCRGARRCRGTLQLRDARGTIGRARFALRRGRVRVRLDRQPARRVVRLRVRNRRGKQRTSFRVRLPDRGQAARSRSR